MKAAGCLFYQNNLVLAAYNPKYQIWSGIGGKIMPDEAPKAAAFRETIEELFGFTPSQDIIDECLHAFNLSELTINNTYGIVPINFTMFVHLSYILRAKKCTSIYYNTIPTEINELVYQRKIIHNAEITHLKIVNTLESNPEISRDLLTDFNSVNLSVNQSLQNKKIIS